MSFRFIATTAAIGFLASSVSAFASFDDQFVCGPFGDGEFVVTLSSADPDVAVARFTLGADNGGGGFVQPLNSVVTGAGFRYVGGSIEFVGNGTDATLIDGPNAASCVFLGEGGGEGEATPDAAGGAIAVNAAGLSLGGKVRTGPGMDFTQVGSLAYGTPITLLEDTGVLMDGYNWFFIQEPNGDTGFQWGGIICAPDGSVPGVFERCE